MKLLFYVDQHFLPDLAKVCRLLANLLCRRIQACIPTGSQGGCIMARKSLVMSEEFADVLWLFCRQPAGTHFGQLALQPHNTSPRLP